MAELATDGGVQLCSHSLPFLHMMGQVRGPDIGVGAFRGEPLSPATWGNQTHCVTKRGSRCQMGRCDQNNSYVNPKKQFNTWLP